MKNNIALTEFTKKLSRFYNKNQKMKNFDWTEKLELLPVNTFIAM